MSFYRILCFYAEDCSKIIKKKPFVKCKEVKMKKKLSASEKNEARLRYRYRELKRSGKLQTALGPNMSFKDFRKSEFNQFETKVIKIKDVKNGKLTVKERIVKKFISLKSLLKGNAPQTPKKEKQQPVTKQEKREIRKRRRHMILLKIQELVSLRKEKKAAIEEEEKKRKEKLKEYLKENKGKPEKEKAKNKTKEVKND